MSKAAAHAATHLKARYPQLAIGRWNCRKISGSSRWSEHAWGNGLDLTHRDYGYTTDPANQAFLDGVNEWLETHRDDLSIRVLLWRKPSHYNHIHVDFWPRGHGTPPCAGGDLQMKKSDGTVVAGDPGPENGVWDGIETGGPMTPEQVAQLALDALDGDPEKATYAVAIAKAESNLRPDAVGDTGLVNDKWGPSIGLWQIRSLHAETHTGKPRDASRLREPDFNAASMATISNGGTYWQPWSVYKHGTYEQHMLMATQAVANVLEEDSPVLTPSPVKRPAVELLQTRLNAWDRLWNGSTKDAIVVDGIYGTKTGEYVGHFQYALGLEVTGLADATTTAFLSFYGTAE